MAKYGMYVGNNGGSPWALQFESGDNYTSFGDPDPWVAYARSQGIQGIHDTKTDRTLYPFSLKKRRRLEEQAEGACAGAVEAGARHMRAAAGALPGK
jgi:hypothetical protein